LWIKNSGSDIPPGAIPNPQSPIPNLKSPIIIHQSFDRSIVRSFDHPYPNNGGNTITTIAAELAEIRRVARRHRMTVAAIVEW